MLLEDGTTIGEVPVIQRYLEEIHPEPPLLGISPKTRAQIAMWDRRVEQEGFASVMETVRNAAPGLKNRAIAGPHDYEQIPALVERSRQRVGNFYADFNARSPMSRLWPAINFPSPTSPRWSPSTSRPRRPACRSLTRMWR